VVHAELYRLCAEYGNQAKGIDLLPVEETKVAASAALVSSGTMSLTVALAGIPGAVVYRTNPLTWWLGRRLIAGRIDNLGIANILLKRQAWPEYLQSECDPETLAERLKFCIENSSARKLAQSDAKELFSLLSARAGLTAVDRFLNF
jgi:lipid-A-disaccharide synthase